jgi:hypothetical protein
MKRFVFIALVFGLGLAAKPAWSVGQYGDEPQDPYEYTQEEDEHPLKFASYFLMPVGYALDWAIMRPLHYLATQTSLAPALDSNQYTKGSPLNLPPEKLGPLPPDYSMTAQAPVAEARPAQPPATTLGAASSTTKLQAAPPPPSAQPQPVLH